MQEHEVYQSLVTVIVRVLQRISTSRVRVCTCGRGGIYFKESAHVIVEAGKSATCREGRLEILARADVAVLNPKTV